MTQHFPFESHDLYRSLTALITPLGVQASGGDLYRGAIFGRDSLRVGLDLVPWFPELSETIVLSLAKFQSVRRIEISDATGPGQIPHEIRSRYVGPRLVTGHPAQILDELSPRWGGSDDLLVYYGSVDATLQYVRLIHRHCILHGPALLDIVYLTNDGAEQTLRQSLLAAARWVATQVGASEHCLMWFQRLNEVHGHRWQILQDGATSILHIDGSMANGDDRVETVGLQGLAWDALTQAAELLAGEEPEEAANWLSLANQLRAELFGRFWIPEERYFLTGYDRDPVSGQPRAIAALTALPVELLETTVFDTLEEADRSRYLSGILHMAHGSEFLTVAGIRSRARRHADLLDYPDYHGVFTCWGVTNSVYAFGLRKQGFGALADDIVYRHLGMLAGTGGLHEFMYVNSEGDVRWPLVPTTSDLNVTDVVYGTNAPEINQAWTLSFALRSLLEREAPTRNIRPSTAAVPSDSFPDELLFGFQPPEMVSRHMHPAVLDRAEGRRREADFLGRSMGGVPESD